MGSLKQGKRQSVSNYTQEQPPEVFYKKTPT